MIDCLSYHPEWARGDEICHSSHFEDLEKNFTSLIGCKLLETGDRSWTFIFLPQHLAVTGIR